MREIVQQLIKVIQNGEIAIRNLVDIDSEMSSIFKMFPLMSINEKKEAIKRYEELGRAKPTWHGQIDLVKEFLGNTMSDLAKLKNGWFENKSEAHKLKKLYKMMENEFEADDEVQGEEPVFGRVEPSMTEDAKATLKNDIQAIQEEKKEANKIQNTNKK
jgi:hypothetical protein